MELLRQIPTGFYFVASAVETAMLIANVSNSSLTMGLNRFPLLVNLVGNG